MRFRCEHCKAGYSVPDGKVRDKVVRMQCLKCKGEIVITGPHQITEPAKKAKPPRFQHEWWVIADGDQQGPFSEAELIGRLKAGKLDRASHAWRQGMEGWLHLDEIPEFAPFAKKSLDAVLTLDPHDEDPDPRLRTAVAPPPFVPVAETAPTGPAAPAKREVTAVFTVKARSAAPPMEKTKFHGPKKNRRTVYFVLAGSLSIIVAIGVAWSFVHAPSLATETPIVVDAPPPPAGAGLVPPGETPVPKKPKVVSPPPKSNGPLVVKVNGMSFREESDVRPAWLTPENVKRSVSLNQDALGPCLGNDTGPRGKCAVGFRITPDGRVKNITISPARIKDSALGRCLNEMFGAMRFPKFDGEFKELELSMSVTQ